MAITLLENAEVCVNLCEFRFDEGMDCIYALVEVLNHTNKHLEISLCDVWDGEQFYDYKVSLITVPPNATLQKPLLEPADDESIANFHSGNTSPVACRLAVFTYEQNADEQSILCKSSAITVKRLSMSGVAVAPFEDYQFECDGECIFATTNRYLPFEFSKDDFARKAFKTELCKRIEKMHLFEDNILVAQYGEVGKPRFFDVENMCIYNLGTSIFSACCQTDIAFMELTKSDMNDLKERFPQTANRQYFYAYSSYSRAQLNALCHSKILLANWNGIDIKTDIINSPQRYWISIREQFSRVKIYRQLETPQTDCFGIKLTLHLPRKVLPASVMKSLLDGVVCAFHKSHNADTVLHSLTNEEYETMVINAEKNISLFGKQNYVSIYRENSIKWNPADERLKFAWVSVIEEDCIPFFDGEIYEW